MHMAELIECEDVHSEDEQDDGGKDYIVKRKEGRNPLLTMAFRSMDDMIAAQAQRQRRTRCVATQSRPSSSLISTVQLVS